MEIMGNAMIPIHPAKQGIIANNALDTKLSDKLHGTQSSSANSHELTHIRAVHNAQHTEEIPTKRIGISPKMLLKIHMLRPDVKYK